MVPTPFLPIADPRILAIPIQECGEPLVSVEKESWLTIVPDENHNFFRMRASVAKRLRQAAEALADDFRLGLVEAYRPLAIQRQYFLHYQEKVRREHPDWDAAAVNKETSIFVAPPDAVPPHTTGAAVDLDVFLLGPNGQTLDVGSKTYDIGGYGDISRTLSPNVTPEQKHIRERLIAAMSNVGFVNYPAEWWHWSYGDRYWAYYKKQPYALYGTIEN